MSHKEEPKECEDELRTILEEKNSSVTTLVLLGVCVHIGNEFLSRNILLNKCQSATPSSIIIIGDILGRGQNAESLVCHSIMVTTKSQTNKDMVSLSSWKRARRGRA